MKLLGIRGMLIDAINVHRRETLGDIPLRFELHPEIVRELKLGISATDMCFDPLGNLPMRFYGVEIREDLLANRAKMITSDNVVEYL